MYCNTFTRLSITISASGPFWASINRQRLEPPYSFSISWPSVVPSTASVFWVKSVSIIGGFYCGRFFAGPGSFRWPLRWRFGVITSEKFANCILLRNQYIVVEVVLPSDTTAAHFIDDEGILHFEYFTRWQSSRCWL